MNILIVDDNKNNRMIINLLLEDYSDDNDVAFNIDEVVNGQEAVDIVKTKKFDLVFMDIMMPVMDGIEATKLIREYDDKLMIIAVSAVDDAQRQKQILSSGAEDYISKPINSDIFLSRIENYIKLINSRKHTKESSTHFNLYTNKIFQRHLIFFIGNDDALSEFWEYYLLNDDDKYDGLSDVVRTLYSFGELELKLKQKASIVVEESEEKIFFTLKSKEIIEPTFVRLVTAKNAFKGEYKHKDNLLSFVLSKEISVVEEVIEPISEEIAQSVEVENTTSVDFKASVEHLEVFDFMDVNDQNELNDYISKLNSLLLIVGSGGVEYDDIEEMSSLMNSIGSLLTIYTETYDISSALSSLSTNILEHSDTFIENSTSIGPLCSAFGNDLATWNRMIFHDGAPSIDFMNDTIVANSSMISSMINGEDESNTGELDDIFNF